jgi:uncharacterized membrane protein
VRIVHHLRLRPSLAVGLAVLVLVTVAGSLVLRPGIGLVAGWDCGVLAYLATIWSRMAGADTATIRRRAASLDQGRWGIFLVTIGAALASLVAYTVSAAYCLHRAARALDVPVVWLLRPRLRLGGEAA